LCKYIYPVLRY